MRNAELKSVFLHSEFRSPLDRFRLDVSRYGEALDTWRIPGKCLNHKDTRQWGLHYQCPRV